MQWGVKLQVTPCDTPGCTRYMDSLVKREVAKRMLGPSQVESILESP